MTAVAVPALLVSKVLQKARELSAKLFESDLLQPPLPKQEQSRLNESIVNPSVQKQPLQTKTQTTSKIPPKPVMSAETAAKTAYADYRIK